MQRVIITNLLTLGSIVTDECGRGSRFNLHLVCFFLQEDVINTQCGYDVRQHVVGISSISVDLFIQGNQGNL